ncbi:hypothetical protein D3C87_2113340 [compost metagenome]
MRSAAGTDISSIMMPADARRSITPVIVGPIARVEGLTVSSATVLTSAAVA